jgi:hypothetical protein
VSTERLATVAMLIAVLSSSALAVADEAPTLELEVSPTSVRVGDRVRVLASARGGENLLWGELTVAVEPEGPWAVVDPPVAIAGARPPAWEFNLAPIKLGEQSLPAMTVSVRDAGGDTAEVGCEQPPTVTVVSVITGDEEQPDPAPLRDPIGVRGPPWEWVLPAVGALLPLLAGMAWWWRSRVRPAPAARRVLPPSDELEALLAELETRVGREPADGVCDRLAAGLRHYLERRTGDPAEEMTSFELRLLARRRGWPETAQRLLQRVMGVADGVRFGRRPTTDEELRQAIETARETAATVEAHLSPADDDTAAVEAGR